MTTKRAVAYIGMIVVVLFALKMYSDRTSPTPAEEFAQEQENHEIPTPDFPVNYSLGEFDDRFGISKEKFLEIAEQARKVWEDAAGKALFNLRGDGELKINLIFDWRQERLLEATKAKAKLDENGRSFDQLQADYNERSERLDRIRSSFDEAAQTFKIHLDEYNARVARWNESTNHNESEYRALQSAGKEIQEERNSLEQKRTDLNTLGQEFNKLGEKLTALAQLHNLEVGKFNGAYAQSRDFEKGVFDGKAINIYEFEKDDDLRLALVHEFGHAIGLGHADNPKAIMFRKLAVQGVSPIRLTDDDLKLLRSRVR
jgi:hypothetical protein